MQYKSFFNFEQYHHPHKRHDPPGSEDADVNNDGKVDQNDKYILAKRRLYQQYKQMQKSHKPSDFSIPKLENNMIKMSGLVDLKPLKEEEKWIQKAIKKPGALHKQLGVPQDEPIPAGTLAAAAEKGGKLGKRARLAMTLKKLKEMELTPDQEKKIDELTAQMEELTANQKKLDVDKDGKIEADDLAKLRAGKKDEIVAENEDHEVSMAHNLLEDIIKNATELQTKLGKDEKDVPAWIQDHISQAQNFISQANVNYHEYDAAEKVPHPEMDKPVDKDLEAMNEAAPEGWEKTIKAMKKHKEIDNPWALANWMKKKGYQPQKENVEIDENIDEIGLLKRAAYIAKAGKDIWKRSHSMDKHKAAAEKPPRIGKSGSETPASKRDREAGKKSAETDARKIANRFAGIDKALGKKVKNPKTGKEILATTAIKDPSHPAHSAAKSALGKSK